MLETNKELDECFEADCQNHQEIDDEEFRSVNPKVNARRNEVICKLGERFAKIRRDRNVKAMDVCHYIGRTRTQLSFIEKRNPNRYATEFRASDLALLVEGGFISKGDIFYLLDLDVLGSSGIEREKLTTEVSLKDVFDVFGYEAIFSNKKCTIEELSSLLYLKKKVHERR